MTLKELEEMRNKELGFNPVKQDGLALEYVKEQTPEMNIRHIIYV